MTTKRILAIFLFLLSAVGFAQERSEFVKDLYVETRLGWEMNEGLKGQWLNVRVDGQIADGLTYSFRHRLNKTSTASFFDATDWIHLDWAIDERFSVSAGKQVIAIGGYEYDRAPIDLYYCSEFWNNIPCYGFGVSGTFNASENDQLLLQLCNSPFLAWTGNDSYALNLMWYGNHGPWQTMWSVNMMQGVSTRWMNYIALGNRFQLGESMHLELDVMNRYAPGQNPLDDWSLMCEFSANPKDNIRLFAKYTYDINNSGTDADVIVHNGTEINMASLGGEWNIRPAIKAFCAGAYGWGVNTNPLGTRTDGQYLLQMGLKIKLNIK